MADNYYVGAHSGFAYLGSPVISGTGMGNRGI